MSIVGVSFKERAICSVCGATYEDEDSIKQVREWNLEGYAPCPNIKCKGELKIELEIKEI